MKKSVQAALHEQREALLEQFDRMFVGSDIIGVTAKLCTSEVDTATKQLVAKISAALAEHHQTSLS